ncbi:MAG: transcription-repair coupling factor [Gammaproteobacteria bacterium]|nr:MAG: transcription-repair coupling factor [Gammaproteobacteria bacterium]
MADIQSFFSSDFRANTSQLNLKGVVAESQPLLLANIATASAAPLVVITADTASAYWLQSRLRFFADTLEILIFPDWETLPYDNFSPHQDIISDRLFFLNRVRSLKSGIIIIPVPTLIQRLPPCDYVSGNCFHLKKGDDFDITAAALDLEKSGYIRVSQVMDHGEFAVRGSIIDVFPMGSKNPVRIDLFDDCIESIRTFDPESQLTVEKIDEFLILPAREFLLNEDTTTLFRKKFREAFTEIDYRKSALYNDISNGLIPAGIEYYLPLFFEELATIFDYLNSDSLFAFICDVPETVSVNLEEINHRYRQLNIDSDRPLLSPEILFIDQDAIDSDFNKRTVLRFNDLSQQYQSIEYKSTIAPPVRIQARHENPVFNLESFLASFSGKVLICCEGPGRQELLLETLSSYKIFPKKLDSWQKFIDGKHELAITISTIDSGFVFDDKIAIITEGELLGQKTSQQRRRSKSNRDNAFAIKNLSDINYGSPVVHIDHGVGRYIGLQALTIDGTETEFVTLEYAGGDKLYIPVSSLHLVSRYNGAVEEAAPLHRLGTDQWEKAKKKAAEKIRDVAAELLETYAKRATKSGYQYKFDHSEYALFADSFPFEETEDQEEAINSVIESMSSDKPMDMVVCGDVGFGKTEVAMRAAFIGVQGGKQVAMMVPTTLLAQQHYQNFKDRFADWPFRIEVLSRFGTKSEQNKIIDDIKSGQVDIVIGTHKLIQNDISFKRLGLVIVDEEHRFGVRQKEQFKKLRNEVDVLTLTATPIPRTLNMAMSGLRELAVIATPPAKRLSVKTSVSEWNKNLFREAFLRELKRGGQIYFLHNDVKTIEKTTADLQELVPEAKISFAHGQMREAELEQIMSDFYHQKFNVLVCTTIIESGIDIPTANTIIINRADKLGLAQLHQLRGRVGRSHHRAYAYMIIPSRSTITEDAKKRLEAIESLEDLGAGFMLANHDLEIRGAGELLGDEQSGQINEIGFSLYTELLERAVTALRNGELIDVENSLNIDEIKVDIRIPALIPEDYIGDIHTRLVLYKRISSAENDEDIKQLKIEMIDRFGLIPDRAARLFDLSKMKIQARKLGIKQIDFAARGGFISFRTDTCVDPVKIIKLVQHQADRYRLEGSDKLRVKMDLQDHDERYDFVMDILARLG